MHRWGRAAAILVAATVPAVVAIATAASAEARGPSLKRALASYPSLQHYYYVPRHKPYKGEPFTPAWPFSQALAATARLSELPRAGWEDTGPVRPALMGLER